MKEALGFLEFENVSDGIACMDYMLKGAFINVLRCSAVNPGKFFIIISGSYGNIENAIELAINNFDGSILDFYMIGKAEDNLIDSIKEIRNDAKIESIAIIDTFNIVTGVIAADMALKMSNVKIIKFDISSDMGGRTNIILNGEYSSVSYAVEQIMLTMNLRSKIIARNIIANPSEELIRTISSDK
jgi:microcompartment protein CcmL/EutN